MIQEILISMLIFSILVAISIKPLRQSVLYRSKYYKPQDDLIEVVLHVEAVLNEGMPTVVSLTRDGKGLTTKCVLTEEICLPHETKAFSVKGINDVVVFEIGKEGYSVRRRSLVSGENQPLSHHRVVFEFKILPHSHGNFISISAGKRFYSYLFILRKGSIKK